MTCFKLNGNIFLVKGTKKHAIYDLLSLKLFQIDQEAYDFIKKLVKNKIKNLNKEEEQFLKKLCEYNLVVEINKPEREKLIKKTLNQNFKPSFAWLEVINPITDSLMTLDNFYKAKTFLVEYQIEKIQITGKDPLNHPNIKEIILESTKYFEFIEISIDILSLTEEWCLFFKKHNINLAIFINNIDLKELNNDFKIQNINPETLKVFDLITNHKLQARFFTKNKNINNKEEKHCSTDLLKNILITKEYFANSLNKELIIKNISGHPCFENNLYIDYNLEIFPCLLERRISHGKIDQKQNLNFLIKRNIFTDFGKDYIKECKNCEFRYACRDCRANNNNSNINAKPDYCTYNPLSGEWKNLEKI